MTKVFRTAGDLGDCTYQLAIVKHFGGGVIAFEAANYTRVRLTPDKWKPIEPLLRAQPYISDVVEWTGQHVGVNLNDFRALMVKSLRRGIGRDRSLLSWMIEAHRCPLAIENTPWLTVEPNKVARVVFNRTGPGRPPQHTYHNHLFPWHQVYRRYGSDAVFVGLEEEYHVFKKVCADVPFYKTANLLDAARVIAGADLFVGNQSLPLAIAYGLGKPVVIECWLGGPNSNLNRPNVTVGWDHNVELPNI